MKEFSKETIEIDGTEYTLFLNRKGIISWENITKITKRGHELQDKYNKVIEEIKEEEPIEVKDNDNPFDYSEDSSMTKLEEETKALKDVFIKFYWIALYEKHKLSISEVTKWFDKAEEEYGLKQLISLANQMLEDANTNKYGNTEIKKLTALRQTK